MKCLAAVVLVGCSTASIPDAGNVEIAHATDRSIPYTGRHGAAIERFVVGGGAALSQDGRGGTRLWPTLDGRREPIAIAMARAVELVLAHDGEGFLLGGLDEASGLELVRVANDGTVISRAHVEPAFDGVVAASGRVIALRADQTIAIFDYAGTQLARLEPALGERITRLVARGDQVLAMLVRGKDVLVRRIDARGWLGDSMRVKLDPHDTPFMSPDGRWLLSNTILIDLTTQASTKLPIEGVPLGFVDDRTFATGVGAGVAFYGLTGNWVGGQHPPAASMRIAADGVVVAAMQTQLALVTPRDTQYLGYRFGALGNMRDIGGGELLATDGTQRALIMDSSFAVTRELQLPDDPRMLLDAVPLDATHVLATHALGQSYAVSVIERETTQTLSVSPTRGSLRYHSVTGLLELSDSGHSYLVQLDRETMKFEIWYVLSEVADVYLVDPTRTGGVVAIAARTRDGTTTVDEILLADLKVGATLAVHNTYSLRDTLCAVDADGRVYFCDGHGIGVYAHGKQIMRIPNIESGYVAPNGDAIAVYTENQIALYDVDGTQRWAIAAPVQVWRPTTQASATGVFWRGDQLVAVTEASAYTLDLATGAIDRRACGWSFGLSALPPGETSAGESICDAK